MIHSCALVNGVINACRAAPEVISRCLATTSVRNVRNGTDEPGEVIVGLVNDAELLPIDVVGEDDHVLGNDQFLSMVFVSHGLQVIADRLLREKNDARQNLGHFRSARALVIVDR